MRFILPMVALVPVAGLLSRATDEAAVYTGPRFGAPLNLIAVLISVDGESNWLEGAQLIALYQMLGISFYFVG